MDLTARLAQSLGQVDDERPALTHDARSSGLENRLLGPQPGLGQA